MSNTTAQAGTRPFSNVEIAAFVKVFRTNQGWSQETLAELSGLTVRTVQRVENAEPSSIDTRRALARAFRLEDMDIFNRADALKSDEQLRKETEEFERTYLKLDTTIATTGRQLAEFAEGVTMYVFQNAEGCSKEAEKVCASLFDYLREYGDCDELYSFTQKLGVYTDISEYLENLRRAGFSACFAVRHTKIVGSNWANKTPMPVSIGYLSIFPLGDEPKQIAVPKALGQISY
jgi:transcriptional regulator with XRE-family HTH domain